MAATPDPQAAAVYRREAERHYEAADRFRRLGLREAEQAALAAARQADDLADKLGRR
jgi:hypothetical protein